MVFEHITTQEAAQYIAQAGTYTAATITPQHLLYNRNALFTGGLRPHMYRLPVLKREVHRQALVQAATSGSHRFFLGTDSAPHPAHLKEHASGCAGCYSAPAAIELYAEAFAAAGASPTNSKPLPATTAPIFMACRATQPKSPRCASPGNCPRATPGATRKSSPCGREKLCSGSWALVVKPKISRLPSRPVCLHCGESQSPVQRAVRPQNAPLDGGLRRNDGENGLFHCVCERL